MKFKLNIIPKTLKVFGNPENLFINSQSAHHKRCDFA